MWALNDRAGFPPGEYTYEQTEGIQKFFPSVGDKSTLAVRVADFRKGNNLPRATYSEALVDIIQYTCNRLGGSPPWCFQLDPNTPIELTSSAFQPAECHGCGAPV